MFEACICKFGKKFPLFQPYVSCSASNPADGEENAERDSRFLLRLEENQPLPTVEGQARQTESCQRHGRLGLPVILLAVDLILMEL
jgi:hypothetical protein